MNEVEWRRLVVEVQIERCQGGIARFGVLEGEESTLKTRGTGDGERFERVCQFEESKDQVFVDDSIV